MADAILSKTEDEITLKRRLDIIDFMRGFVMVLMALDHVRDFVYASAIDPLDLDKTTAALYATRWITHLCAPVFIILSGVSIGLMAKKMSKKDLSLFLLTRGIWLIFIEMFVISAGWNMDIFHPNWIFSLQVIWAIGASMVMMAAIIWVPVPVIAFSALVLIFGHNLYDTVPPTVHFQTPMTIAEMFHEQGIVIMVGIPFFSAYPIVPWVGVMMAGFAAAPLFLRPNAEIRKVLLTFGLSSLILFIALRSGNIYGNWRDWAPQETVIKSIMSFMNVEKYPPSLLYLLSTLGLASLYMASYDSWRGAFVEKVKGWIITFGRVPFLYYILHIYIARLCAFAIAEAQGKGWQAVLGPYWQYPADHGVSLFWTYVIWAAIVIGLYPVCKWFAGVKARNPHIKILKYL